MAVKSPVQAIRVHFGPADVHGDGKTAARYLTAALLATYPDAGVSVVYEQYRRPMPSASQSTEVQTQIDPSLSERKQSQVMTEVTSFVLSILDA